MTDEDGVSPSEAFAVLGDETRVGIVEALGATDESTLSFTELRSRVGVTDSGQFNYHLQKLLDTFVRRTDEGEYRLTYAGHRIVGAILAGTYNRRGSTDTFDLESTCARCGETVEATYEDERVTIRCSTCDDTLSAFGFPPGGFEGRDPANLTRTLERWVLDVASFAMDGICPNCYGVVEGRLVGREEAFADRPSAVRFDCERCGDTAILPVNAYLLRHPAVVAFYHEHDVDLDGTETWNLPFLREEVLEVRSRDPLRVVSAFEFEGDELEVAVEADLTVRTLEGD